MHVSSPPRTAGTSLRARASTAAISRQLLGLAPLVLIQPCDPEAEGGAAGAGEGAGLAYEVWVIVGVFDEDFVED